MASNIEFEYINEDSINHSLKCSICNQPFVRPVSTNCKKRHKFCRHCIEEWLHQNPSCPTCRQTLNREDLVSITEDIVVDVLNELQVKCTGCGQTGLDRGDFNDHLKHSCPAVTVNCSAQDMKCPWVGHRDLLAKHLKKCSFQSLRPLIVSLTGENQELKRQVTELATNIEGHRREMQQLKERMNQQVTKIEGQNNEITHLKTICRQNGLQIPHFRTTTTTRECVT